MAFYFQKPYGPEIEQQLRQYYQSLSEKDRRRFAAVKAGASKSLRRFFPIFGAWSCLELLSSHGNHGYVAV